jgi:hypothetical protein
MLLTIRSVELDFLASRDWAKLFLLQGYGSSVHSDDDSDDDDDQSGQKRSRKSGNSIVCAHNQTD